EGPEVGEAPLAPLERVEVADENLMIDLCADRPDDRLMEQPQRKDRAVALHVLEQEPERVRNDPLGVRPTRRGAPRRQLCATADPTLAPQVVAEPCYEPHLHRCRCSRGNGSTRGLCPGA